MEDKHSWITDQRIYFPTIYDRKESQNFTHSFMLTQFLSGHGNFGTYFERFNIPVDRDSMCTCHTGHHAVQHMLFDWPIFKMKRYKLHDTCWTVKQNTALLSTKYFKTLAA